MTEEQIVEAIRSFKAHAKQIGLVRQSGTFAATENPINPESYIIRALMLMDADVSPYVNMSVQAVVSEGEDGDYIAWTIPLDRFLKSTNEKLVELIMTARSTQANNKIIDERIAALEAQAKGNLSNLEAQAKQLF